jgi:hypothetical protein
MLSRLIAVSVVVLKMLALTVSCYGQQGYICGPNGCHRADYSTFLGDTSYAGYPQQWVGPTSVPQSPQWQSYYAVPVQSQQPVSTTYYTQMPDGSWRYDGTQYHGQPAITETTRTRVRTVENPGYRKTVHRSWMTAGAGGCGCANCTCGPGCRCGRR